MMHNIKLTILLALIMIMVAAPFVFAIYSAGSHWQGIFPTGFISDSGFYMTRLVKGTQIFPFGNNPFFIEHKNGFNLALSIADYIGAIPLKMGFSMTTMLIFNAVFWNLIFVWLLWLFLRELGVKNNWIFYFIPVIYTGVYAQMIRLVVIEIVFPFFLFFLLAFVLWLKRPSIFNSSIFALGIAGALYIYPFTWQIAFSMLGLYFLWFLKNREWSKIKSLFQIIPIALIAALPAIFCLYLMFSNPLFQIFLDHVGAIKTHLPSAVSFYQGRWVIINAILWFVVAWLVPKLRENNNFRFSASFLVIMGFGILTVLMSPIIIGRDGAIGDHVGRELFFWLSVSVSVLTYYIFSSADFYRQQFYKKLFICVFLILSIIPILRQSERSLSQIYNTVVAKDFVSVQDYAKPISWLDRYDKNPSVVWAKEMGDYINIWSKHYSFSPSDLGYQYWIDISEMQERFLGSNYFEELTLESLGQDFHIPLGYSYFRRFVDLDWKLKICSALKFTIFDRCNPILSGQAYAEVVLQKDKEIHDLIDRNKKDIRPHINELLKKYHVTYAIKDLKIDSNFHVEKLKNAKEIYNDGRFIIYQF